MNKVEMPQSGMVAKGRGGQHFPRKQTSLTGWVKMYCEQEAGTAHTHSSGFWHSIFQRL